MELSVLPLYIDPLNTTIEKRVILIRNGNGTNAFHFYQVSGSLTSLEGI